MRNTKQVLLEGFNVKVFYDEDCAYFSHIDYQKFKLFQLSILWRASVASHPMFSTVRLGPHEEIIRNMITNQSPGQPLDYPCLMYKLESDSNIHTNVIGPPRLIRMDSHIAYRFIFSGFIWIYYVSSHKKPLFIDQISLDLEGNLIMGKAPFDELTELNDFARKLHQMGRLKPRKRN